MYKIGDIVQFVPEALRYSKDGGNVQAKKVPGVVVYIHPQRRYIVVERTVKCGYKYREALWIARKGQQPNEDNCNYESEGRGRQNRHGPKFGGLFKSCEKERAAGRL